MRIGGLHGCARGWYVAKLFEKHRKIAILCKDQEDADNLISDLAFFTSEEQVFSYPAWDILPFEHVSPQTHITAERIATLYAIHTASSFLSVIPADAFLQRTIPKELLFDRAFSFSVGEALSVPELADKLSLCGYKEVSLVQEVGEMAKRGSVIDLFPARHPAPLRIEIKEGLIEKIRYFDVDSQRSYAPAERVTLTPVRELIPFNDVSYGEIRESAFENIRARGKALDTPPREIVKSAAAVRDGEDIPGAELLMAVALPQLSTVLSHLPKDTHVVLADDLGIFQRIEEFTTIVEEREARLSGEHFLIPPREALYQMLSEVRDEISAFSRTSVDSLGITKPSEEGPKQAAHRYETHSLIELTTKLRTKIGTGDAFEPLVEAIHAWRKKGYVIAFAVGSHSRAERLHRLLLDVGIDARHMEGSAGSWFRAGGRYPVVILQGHLSQGVQISEEKVVFIAENEIFAERSYRKSKTSKTSLKKLLSSLAQLLENDFIVHADFGIGIYRGLTHREIEGSESDFLHIEYADSTLYLPVQNIGKVQKFVAAEGQNPQLDKLGSNRWVKTKEKIRESVLPLAGDLIKLYAARSVAKGWRFEPYGAEDERFADEFAYNETPDQLKAIQDTLTNMAEDKPMDRLVCGDVGFGKTEVAIRAAFKCVQHQRQVAVLVPTTLLVEQHYRTFCNRFNGYPTKIGVLSRFHSAEANKKTLELLASGDIDIVVGTHKLLQRNVVFNDLGLLIIDEEHRFGVKQKEQLKALKKQVDVLTLTATPIPRTLHMSLLGIRDISVISTPPVDRRIIRTYIASFDDTLVRDAILRELQRGGQCFYVHNRVQSIDLCTAALKEIVPEARFRFAHGQMSEHELEDIMRDFLDRKIDVLVTTTIIESGIDIPSANTIMIERADTYGLAQLYQLRGRVGRSDQQAYAYFLIPKANKLGLEAQRRLKALQSLDDLGLGFNLAIRDLEIRGAGNLLGKEQSGNVLAVGFELYSKILKEAVLHLKGEEVALEETVDPEVKLGINAFIPEWYIPDISERLVLYQRLSGVRSNEEMNELTSEIEDRFGPIGREVFDLIELMRFRSLLRHYGVVRAELKNMSLSLSLSSRARVDAEKIFALVSREPQRIKFGRNLTISINFPILNEPAEIYGEVRKLLKEVSLVEAQKPARLLPL